MKRTQIYLRESQREELDKLATRQGVALAELIREAVDYYIAEKKQVPEDCILETQGLWKDHDDISAVNYVNKLRSELSTRLEEPPR